MTCVGRVEDMDVSEARAARLAELKGAIESGSYRVLTNDLAECLMQSMLGLARPRRNTLAQRWG